MVTWTPPPGAIGLTTSYGFTRLRAAFGHMLLGEVTEFSHAFIVLGDGWVMEPWPSGARVAQLSEYTGDYVAYGWPVGMTETQHAAIADAARSLDGIGYGVTDYWVLRRARDGSRRALARCARGARLTPAQCVAEAYRRAGVPLWDGRPDVTLEDIAGLLLATSGWELRIPATEYT